MHKTTLLLSKINQNRYLPLRIETDTSLAGSCHKSGGIQFQKNCISPFLRDKYNVLVTSAASISGFPLRNLSGMQPVPVCFHIT